MEEYVREAPSVVIVPSQQLELPERLMLTYHPEESVPDEDNKSSCEEPHPWASENIEASDIDGASPSATPAYNPDTGDLLGLNDTSPDASAIEDNSALALAILPTDGASTSSSGAAALNNFDPTGWELALVTTPSTDISAPVERKLAGGLDLLTLGSLYDEASYRANQQQSMYGSPPPNPFEVNDPFAVSNNIPPPLAFQMNGMSQPQNNLFGPYPAAYPQQHNYPWAHPTPLWMLGSGQTR